MLPVNPPRVIVRKIRPRPAPPTIPPPARTAGQKIGLTYDQILEAAKRTLMLRPGPISVKAVAAELGVAHNSVSARLRRDGTTLERELTKDLLNRISRPMRPGEDWRFRLGDLFSDAMAECLAHPGLGQVAISWLGQSSRLSVDFTEQTLHLLALAGLSPQAAESSVDVLAAALCGGLAVQFPNFGAQDPREWARAVALEMKKVPAHRFPLTSRSQASLSAIAASKASTAHSMPRDHRGVVPHEMAQVLITFIESKRMPPEAG